MEEIKDIFFISISFITFVQMRFIHKIYHNKSVVTAGRVFAIFTIFIFTFPKFFPSYGTGLDSSYVWGLNWLFANDYNTLKQLIYPFGPLAFLKIPSSEGYNFLLSLIFFCLLKLYFISLLFKTSDTLKNKSNISSIFIILIICYFVNIDFLIIGSCILQSFLFINSSKKYYFFSNIILSLIGLFIKTSIGITSFCVIITCILLFFLSYKNIRLTILLLTSTVLISILGGIIVFGNISLLYNFIEGVFRLSKGYGDTLSLHPNNYWVFLIPFIVLMLSYPLINKEKNVKIIFILSILPLFAMWKHSFIREDSFHYSIFIQFLFVFWGILLMVAESKGKTLLIFYSTTVLLLTINFRAVSKEPYIKKDLIGINNLLDVIKYNKVVEDAKNTSQQNINKHKLNSEILDIIKDYGIDVYPWEFTYIAANQLNWKPRKTLEIGASTSRWASQKASINYNANDNSPEFVLFHLENDSYDGTFGSIDKRYILNDEPLLIYNLFNNYRLLIKSDNYLIFKKSESPLLVNNITSEIKEISFNEWVDLPVNKDKITRLKVFSKNTFRGFLKKLLYKGDEYYIDYLLENGNIFTYRYIPSTAVDGIWCNPLIRYPNSDIQESLATKIRLRNSNSKNISKVVKVQFEHISMEDKSIPNISSALFHKNIVERDTVIYSFHTDFEHLSPSNKIQRNDFKSYFGKYSNIVPKEGFSYTHEIHLDSLWAKTAKDTLIIEANIQAINNYSNAGLVISSDNFWEINYLYNSINKSTWHSAYLKKKIYRSKDTFGILKIYVFNGGRKDIFVDDFSIKIKEVDKNL